MKFDCGEEEEDSFQKFKEAITEAPLLVYPKGVGVCIGYGCFR